MLRKLLPLLRLCLMDRLRRFGSLTVHEATRAIRETEKVSGTHVPIIALTAYAMKGDQDRCLAAGMDGYLSKPIHAIDLLRIIEVYGRQKLVDP